MDTALVTGVGGQDGAYLAEQLSDLGYEVHGTMRTSELESAPQGITVHALDLRDAAAAGDLVRRLAPALVFNSAGMSAVARSWDDPVDTMRVNAVAPIAMMDAALSLPNRPRFVQASSGEIFAGSGPGPFTEATPLVPTTPYGASKAAAHQMVSVYRSRGLHASSCILFNHESPRRPSHFVTRKITMAVARIAAGDTEPLTLGDATARRDWGWAPDYTRGMISAALHAEPSDYVFATGVTHSVEEFTAAAFAAAGISDWRDHVAFDPALLRPNDAPVLVGDASRAGEVLNWQPETGFAELVAAMVQHDLLATAHTSRAARNDNVTR